MSSHCPGLSPAFPLLGLYLHDNQIKTKVAGLIAEEAMRVRPFLSYFTKRWRKSTTFTFFPPNLPVDAGKRTASWCTGEGLWASSECLTVMFCIEPNLGPSLLPFAAGCFLNFSCREWSAWSQPHLINRQAVWNLRSGVSGASSLLLIFISLSKKLTGCYFACSIFVMLNSNNRFLSHIHNPCSVKMGKKVFILYCLLLKCKDKY